MVGCWTRYFTYGLLSSGPMIFDIDDGADLSGIPNIHFTMIFNTFVMMTLCNEINARKIHGERNVFVGIHRNPIFVIIWIATVASQVWRLCFLKRAQSKVILQRNPERFPNSSFIHLSWLWDEESGEIYSCIIRTPHCLKTMLDRLIVWLIDYEIFYGGMNQSASNVFFLCCFFCHFCFEMGLEKCFWWNVECLPSWFSNSFQVILVEFGGYAFSTIGLSLEHWLYCILFGVGTLVWQQVVTTIPARKMPKCMRWGKEVPTDADIEAALGEHGELNPDGSRRPTRHGQILWMRSLTRLQQQVSREKKKEENETPFGVGVFPSSPCCPSYHPSCPLPAEHLPSVLLYQLQRRTSSLYCASGGNFPFLPLASGRGRKLRTAAWWRVTWLFFLFFCMFWSSSSPSSFVLLIVSFQFCSISRLVLCVCVCVCLSVCVCVWVFSPCLKFNSP